MIAKPIPSATPMSSAFITPSPFQNRLYDWLYRQYGHTSALAGIHM
jgi:hypothetical protein